MWREFFCFNEVDVDMKIDFKLFVQSHERESKIRVFSNEEKFSDKKMDLGYEEIYLELHTFNMKFF